MPASPFALTELTSIIVSRFPHLRNARFTLLSAGWDSVAVDADDRLIFKFPQADAEAGLRLEASILRLVRAHVSLPLPDLELIEGPRLFSRHEKIPGEHLVSAQCNGLEPAAREDLAAKLGRFYAELHAIDPAEASAAGAEHVGVWPPAEEILRLAWPVLPRHLRVFSERVMARWAELGPDPFGERYGFFDGHGWNMAFDHARKRLNGVYDFGDSGMGPLHREFIYSSLVSPELTERIIGSYEQVTGRSIDRERVDILTGTHRLWELAGEAHLPNNVPDLVKSLALWIQRDA